MSARAWADGLEEREDGWWPAFDLDVITTALAGGTRRDYWAEWERIQCPTLVVRGEHGSLLPETAEDMLLKRYEWSKGKTESRFGKEVADMLVELYTKWDKPEKAAEWRVRAGPKIVRGVEEHSGDADEDDRRERKHDPEEIGDHLHFTRLWIDGSPRRSWIP